MAEEKDPAKISHSDQVRLAATPKWLKRAHTSRAALILLIPLVLMVMPELGKLFGMQPIELDNETFSRITLACAAIFFALIVVDIFIIRGAFRSNVTAQAGAPKSINVQPAASQSSQRLVANSARPPEQARAYFGKVGPVSTNEKLKLEIDFLWITYFVFVAMLMVALLHFESAAPVIKAVAWLASIFFMVAMRMRLKAKALDVETAIGKGEPFLLYLRSFDDDENLGLEHSRYGVEFEKSALQPLRRSYLIAAVAHPGRELPTLDSVFPIYFDSEHWKSKVEEILGRCRYVILVLGTGNGLDWEMKRTLGGAEKDKAILFCRMAHLK